MVDIGAIELYRHYGFVELIDAPKTLFLPIETVIKAAKGLAVFSICLWFDRLSTNGLIQDFPNVQYLSAG